MNKLIFDYYEVFQDGKIKGKMTGKILKPSKIWNGYLIVILYVAKVRKSYLVHRLVAEKYIGSVEGFQVNHIDGIKTNNDVSNLEIVTQSQNMRHLIDVLGFKHTGNKVRRKIMRLSDGMIVDSMKDACKIFNVSRHVLRTHCKNRNSTGNEYKIQKYKYHGESYRIN